MLPPGALFELKIHQNAYAAGVSPRTPLEKLTELPWSPALRSSVETPYLVPTLARTHSSSFDGHMTASQRSLSFR